MTESVAPTSAASSDDNAQQENNQQQQQRQQHEKIKLKEINTYITCYLCKGYLIDATTITECLHSFCRSCIIRFLEDNSYCPVCDVIINKAKPNLKPDKTLQDIVYKLVPGLFLDEMLRRKRFFAEQPAEAAQKVSPELRGEDTERTIFNPQDRISLSLEYIGDASKPPGFLLKQCFNKQFSQTENTNNDRSSKLAEDNQENLLRRYLQCPGMCRVDVIKKFVRNKYSVDTDLYNIDILYKRVPVPLPDHYTLIDVAYIYTWKRNEPMKFFYRIVEKERANDDLEDPVLEKVFKSGDNVPMITRTPKPCELPRSAKKSEERKRQKVRKSVKKALVKTEFIKEEMVNKEDKTPHNPQEAVIKSEPVERNLNNVKSEPEIERVKTEPEEKPEFDPKNDNSDSGIDLLQSDESDVKVKRELDDVKSENLTGCAVQNSVVLNEKTFSNIPIKTETLINAIEPKIAPMSLVRESPPNSTPQYKIISPKKEGMVGISKKIGADSSETAKYEFLKSIELTSKDVVEALAKQQRDKVVKEIAKDKPKEAARPAKRKNNSPVKWTDASKRPKSDKKPTMKIILQQKADNENIEKLLKHIPSSLSITLQENDQPTRKPPSSVQNYIEILKLPDEKTNGETKPPTSPVTSAISLGQISTAALPKTLELKTNEVSINGASFQKIFEESIKKTEPDETPLTDTSNGIKKDITKISQKLQKKSKPDKIKSIDATKIAIPQINSQKIQSVSGLHSSSLGLHYTVSVGQTPNCRPILPAQIPNSIPALTKAPQSSPSLPKNVTSPPAVSPKNEHMNVSEKTTPLTNPKRQCPDVSSSTKRSKLHEVARDYAPRSSTCASESKSPDSAITRMSPLTANQLLEKYNIQNLAQITASAAAVSPAAFAGLSPGSQLAAFHQAMLLKQLEFSNFQKWMSVNSGPLMQFENYLKSLNSAKNQLLGNIKEN